MKRVLVTGSSGFVGGVLTGALAAEGYDVWGADHQKPTGAAQCVVADLTDANAVRAVLDDVHPAFIIHLAAQSSAGQSFAEPGPTIHNNVLPVLNILEYLRMHGTGARLLAVGSSEVYGPVDASALPLVETRTPNPVSPYALSKLMQEQLCLQYAGLYDIDVVLTRSFNHTGRGQADTFVLPSFARQIVEIKRGEHDRKIKVGNIDIRRDFLDVVDVCRAYISLLGRGRRGGVYNVCSGTSYSLRELLEKLAAVAGIAIEIEVDTKRVRPVDIEELRGDNTRLVNDTGWSAQVPIDETMASLLDHWMTNRNVQY